MNRNDLIKAYDSITLSEEKISDMEAKLLALYDEKKVSSEPDHETAVSYKTKSSDTGRVKPIFIIASAAAVIALCVIGGKLLLDGRKLPVSDDGSSGAATSTVKEDTDETAESIESCVELPVYEHSGIYNDDINVITGRSDMRTLDEKLSDTGRVNRIKHLAKIEITGCEAKTNDLGEEYMLYTGMVQQDYLSPGYALGEMTFTMRSGITQQYYGLPPYTEGDVILTLLLCPESYGQPYEVFTEYGLLFDCYTIDGTEYAAARGTRHGELVTGLESYMSAPALSYPTTTPKNPAEYYGLYKVGELAPRIVSAVKSYMQENEKVIEFESFELSMDLDIFENAFMGYWEGERSFWLSYQTDFMWEYPYSSPVGFAENDKGWYMRTHQMADHATGESSVWKLWFIPRSNPDQMYEYDISPTDDTEYGDSIRGYRRTSTATDTDIGESLPLSRMGIEKLIRDHSYEWLDTFLSLDIMYTEGPADPFSFTDESGRKWVRAPYIGADHSIADWANIFLIDHDEDGFTITLQFVAQDWLDYVRGATDSYNGDGDRQYFNCRCERDNGEWKLEFTPAIGSSPCQPYPDIPDIAE